MLAILLGASQPAPPADEPPPAVPAPEPRKGELPPPVPGPPVEREGIERLGWTVGGGAGLGRAYDSDGSVWALALSLRVGHSLNEFWMLQYDLESMVALGQDAAFWHTTHNATLQWHLTPRLFVKAGLGVGYRSAGRQDDPSLFRLGISFLAGAGFELVQGPGWTVDVQGSFTAASSGQATGTFGTFGGTVGFQFW